MTFSPKDTRICKGFGILIMLFHHMYADVARFSDVSLNFAPLSQGLAVEISNYMKICVGIYVFLSAYGLALSYDKWKKGDGTFIAFRYLKMMVPFFAIYVLMILLSLVFGENWNISKAYGLAADPGLRDICALGFAMVTDFLGLAHLFGTPTFCATWWYMSLAILIILLIPLLCRLCRKLGWGYAAILAAAAPFALGLNVVSLTRYFLCIVLGVGFAQENILAKCKETVCRKGKLGYFLGFTALLTLSFLLRQGKYKGALIEIWDSVIPVLWILYIYFFVCDLPILSRALDFFGKYSTTMFLTHTFIRYYWFRPLVYSQENAWLNYLILVALSTAAAMVIDGAMQLLRLEKLTGKAAGLVAK